MKVLLVHNYYGSTAPSGENQVFEAERAMLERHGVTVDVYTRHSDEIRIGEVERNGGGGQRRNSLFLKFHKLYGLIKGAVCTVANPMAARALARKIREFKPDVVHFHNTFPLISPLAIRAAKKSGAKVVMTLHNYRIVCAAGIPMRSGKVCRECFALSEESNNQTIRTILPAIYHRCYRGSLLATIPLAINIWLYRKCWKAWVNRFIVLSDFQKDRMVECGFPKEQIVVKGNFISSENGVKEGGVVRKRKNQVLYVGRLSDEKGIVTLLEAWRMFKQSKRCARHNFSTDAEKALINQTILKIVGDGDRRAGYMKLVGAGGIKFCGQLSHDKVLSLMAESLCIIQPSACWETFGLTVVEAMSVGTPAVVSDVGFLPSLISGCGLVFKVGDAQALAKAISMMVSGMEWGRMSARARQVAKMRYSEDGNFSALVGIYGELDASRTYDTQPVE